MKSDPLNILKTSAEDEEFQMAPMIDVVFLLLIYFMVTTSLLKFETDLGIQLPGQVQQTVKLKMPDEQIVEVKVNGDVLLNNRRFNSGGSHYMPELEKTLLRFRQACDLANTPPMVTVQADDDTRHQQVIDVLNACAAAGIKNVSIGLAGSS